PPGISVMGERHDLDLVRIAEAAGERLFPVHRIDKATSGLILFARELRFHGDLTRQFARRTAGKRYLVLTRTRGLPVAGTIDLPLSVGRKNRVRVAANRADIAADRSSDSGEGCWSVPAGAVFDHVPVYPSVTTFVRLWEGGEFTLLAATPVTGRRHQIRVHLAWIGHPVDGDPLFDRAATSRTLLHSWRLAIYDIAGERLRLEAPPGPGFWTPAAALIPAGIPATLPDLVPWDPPASDCAPGTPEDGRTSSLPSSPRPAAARRRRSGGRGLGR
ncbi:RluA family pseudouridine synthase, partial [Frankia canadensis]